MKSFKVRVFWPNCGMTSKQSTDFSKSAPLDFLADSLVCLSLWEQDMATATFCHIFTLSGRTDVPFEKWLPVGVRTVSDTPMH